MTGCLPDWLLISFGEFLLLLLWLSFSFSDKPYKALIKNIKNYLKIFENIQKVALSDRLPARLAAYTFWSLLLLLLMLLLGAVALAVAVAFAFAVAV